VLAIVLIGIAILLRGHTPGDIVSWYLVAYAVGRFCFEFMRGDVERTYFLGFSEAQWTSLLIMCAVAWAEVTGRASMQSWHIVAAGGVALAMVGVTLNRRLRGTLRYQILLPSHVREVADAVDQISTAGRKYATFGASDDRASSIDLYRTSLGIQVSAGKICNRESSIDHYTLSAVDGAMSDETAGALASLIVRLRHPSSLPELITRGRGVFHLLIRAQNAGSKN
jgi:hypothetical protein